MYTRPHRRALAAATACSVASTVLSLVPLLVVRALVDDLQHNSESFGRVAVLAAAVIGLLALAGLINVLRTWIVLRVGTSIVAQLRHELVARLLDQSVGYYTRKRGGELMSRVLNDVGAVDRVLSDGTSALAQSAFGVAACIVVMFLLEWRLALLTLIMFPLVVVGLRRAGRPMYRNRRDVQERLAAFTAHTQDSLSLSGIMLIKCFGRERDELQRIDELNETLRHSELNAGMTASWIALGFRLLRLGALAVLLLAAGWLVTNGYATLGTVVAFVTVLGVRFGVSIVNLANGVVTVIGALPACDRIFEVLDAEAEIRERPGARPLEAPVGAVRLESVTFAYPRQTRPAVDNVSLDVEPGQLVALVGPSGAGKTTLSSLVPRFYDPQAGVVRIDGHDLRELRLASLREAVGLVLQDTYLFHGTLRANLLYARADASEEAVEDACSDAHLREVVAGLPDGLDTVVGERGYRLSGGEKQRVAIARVILKDSPILILDEATSHLDSPSERLVQAALARLFRGRTSFVIAHRLSTVLAADQIVVLDRGRVVECGTHPELVGAGGLYRSLYELQFRDRAGEPVVA